MEIAILSDVHANLPALEAVLEDSDDCEMVIHAGDVVGYNPFPNEVIERLRTYDVVSIAGNHDKAVLGSVGYDFPDYAHEAIEWTRNQLVVSQSGLEFASGSLN